MAVVQVNENTLDFIFDSNTNLYNILSEPIILLTLKENTEIYYYNENNELVNLNYTYSETYKYFAFFTEYSSDEDANNNLFTNDLLFFMKYNKDINTEIGTIEKNEWYILNLDPEHLTVMKCNGLRVVNFEYSKDVDLNGMNLLLTQYIGTKTSFAKTYTLRVNGKTLNTINGKKIRNLIYNGTTYEIAEPVASGYTLTIEVSENMFVEDGYYKINGGSAQYTGRQQQTIVINNVEKVAFGASAWDSPFLPEPGSGFYIGSTEGGQEYGAISTINGGEVEITLTGDTTIYLCDGFANDKPIPDIPMP